MLKVVMCALTGVGVAGAAVGESIAFSNTTVLDLDQERTLVGATVLVQEGVITGVGDVALDDATLVIDATGLYLIPGLHDMHVHLASANGPIDAEDQLRFMVTQGVTTARGLVGRPEHLALRERVEAGEILGPRLVCAGPILAGFETGPGAPVITVQAPDEGAAAVRRIAEDGYDLVKVHEALTPEVYDAIIAAAGEVGLPVSGHVTPSLTLASALAAGQQIEHLDGYIRAAQGEPAVDGQPIGQFPPAEALSKIDWTHMERLAAETVEAGVANGPTMSLFALLFDRAVPTEELAARPEMRSLPASMVENWSRQRESTLADGPDDAYVAQLWETRARILRLLADAGALLLTGSDSPQAFMVPGASVHLEMEHFVKAGLSEWDALQAATRDPAVYLGREASSGTIAVGKAADLVLLRDNPLDDISATRAIESVMVRGAWLDRAALDGMLESIEQRAQQGSGQ